MFLCGLDCLCACGVFSFIGGEAVLVDLGFAGCGGLGVVVVNRALRTLDVEMDHATQKLITDIYARPQHAQGTA